MALSSSLSMYIIQKNIISIPFQKKMKGYNNICLFMSMLYNKIKIENNKNNDDLLKTKWEHMRKIIRRERERGGGDIIKSINLNLPYHYSSLFLTFSK
jgi:hypothetical protein